MQPDHYRRTLKNQNGDIAIRFKMPGVQIKVNSQIFANFVPRIVCHGNVLEPSAKGGQICNLRSNTCHNYGENAVKIGSLDPEFSLLRGLFFKRKKLTQAEHTARGAWMPRGLHDLTSICCHTTQPVITSSPIAGRSIAISLSVSVCLSVCLFAI